MPPNQRTTRTAERTSDVQLVAASVLTGFAGAGFILVVQRHLGLTAFSPIAQLWSIWSIAAATLMFAYQQWTIRLGIDHPGRIRTAFRGGPLSMLVLSTLGTALVAGIARTTLFHTSTLFWPVAAGVVVLGTILNGITRGIFATAGRHSMLALAIAAENVIRFVLAVGLILIGAPRAWFGVALLAGFSIVGLMGLPVRGAGPTRSAGEDRNDDPAASTITDGATTLSSAAIAGFLSHVALAGPPILAAFNGADADTVSTMFVVLTAVRLPHLLLQAGAPRAGVVFQSWADTDHRSNLDSSRRGIVAVTIILGLMAGLIGAALGDLLIGGAFGIRGQVDPASYAAIAAAAVLSVGATLATVQLVAEQRNRLLVIGWAVPLGLGTALAVLARLSEIDDIAVGLLVLHATVLVTLSVVPLAGARQTDS